MSFRDKLKKTFSSKKPSSSGSSTPGSGTSPPLRTDIEYYKPHEIPKSKYRGRVDPAHKDKLDAYSFADAFQTIRRKSSQALSGTFSPGGTNAQSAAQSRRSSWMSTSRTKSSLGSSATGEEIDTDYRRKSVASAGVPTEGKLEEETDENSTDGVNRLSRTITAPDRQDIPELRIEKTITLGRPPSSPQNVPFSAEDLEKAMAAATLRRRRGTVVAAAIQPEQIVVGV